jgi:hypothetical protein
MTLNIYLNGELAIPAAARKARALLAKGENGDAATIAQDGRIVREYRRVEGFAGDVIIERKDLRGKVAYCDLPGAA